ncbi:MAG: branched-chain amino acid ABC transporter permease [Synergistales bacterium]|nr:branched-chain amino acid ABC transporter permease [Synergistales bacterium]
MTRYRGVPRFVLDLSAIAVLALVLALADYGLDPYKLRILNLAGINTALALALNLVNGYSGQFSLGHAGFAAIGAYTTALLTMSPAQKQAVFFMVPLVSPLDQIQWPFLPSLVVAGIMAAIAGVLVGGPALRLRGDYLAIATLCFAEIIRVIFTNAKALTNGALGLKAIPPYTTIWWSWGFAVLVIVALRNLLASTYGRALKGIRDDEVAAEAMGVSLFYHKMLAFVLSAGISGVAGGLLANLLTTIDPNMFRFLLTYQILLIVVLGGMGSNTGSVIAAVVVTAAMELLRAVEQPFQIGPLALPGIPGMRMVLFSALLVAVVLFFRQGLMGTRELGWQDLAVLCKRLGRRAVR